MMTPQDAQRMQEDIYRRMSPEEKLDIAFGMWEFGQELHQLGLQLTRPTTNAVKPLEE